MTRSIVRIIVLAVGGLASAIAVWVVYAIVGSELGTTGGILGALVAVLLLGGLLWIAAALLPREREESKGGTLEDARR